MTGSAGTTGGGAGVSGDAGTSGGAGVNGTAGTGEGRGGTGEGRGGAAGGSAGRGGAAGTGTAGTGVAGTGAAGTFGTAGTGGAGTSTTWIHPADPFPGNTMGDLGALLVTSNGDIYLSRLAGLAKSTDHGDSWTTVSGALPSPVVPSLALNALGDIVAGVGRDANGGGANYGAYRFSGGVWTKATGITASLAVQGFAVDKTGAVVAVTGFEGDVYRSTDNGSSYTKVIDHIGTTTGTGSGALAMIGKAGNGDLFTGGELPGGVYRSQDNGITWAQSGLAAPPFNGNVTAIGFNRLGEPLAARVDGGGNALHRYTNGSWTPSSSGIPTYSFVRTVVVNPRSGKLYLGYNNSSNAGAVYHVGRRWANVDVILHWAAEHGHERAGFRSRRDALRRDPRRPVLPDVRPRAVAFVPLYDSGMAAQSGFERR